MVVSIMPLLCSVSLEMWVFRLVSDLIQILATNTILLQDSMMRIHLYHVLMLVMVVFISFILVQVSESLNHCR